MKHRKNTQNKEAAAAVDTLHRFAEQKQHR
jgi:hypothetical protein